MTREKKRPYSRFGSWLKGRRELEGLTQAEAVEKMRLIAPIGKGVDVSTWSRWENGHRLPPRTKIDFVAKVIKVDPKRVRQRAGINVPTRKIRRDRNDLIASMLRVLSSGSGTRAKILNLYALFAIYYGKSESEINLKLMTEIARVFDLLKDKSISEQVRVATFTRIEQLCRAAKKSIQVTVPPDRAMLVCPKRGFPPVMLGSTISIEYFDENGDAQWDSYTVRDIKTGSNKVRAYLECENR